MPYQERRTWRARLEQAKDYAEWSLAAAELDRIEGLHSLLSRMAGLGSTHQSAHCGESGKTGWKSDPISPDYDNDLVAARLSQLRDAHELGDRAATCFLLRTSMTR